MRIYGVAHTRFQSSRNAITAAQPASRPMRYRRVNQGCSQKGSRRCCAQCASAAPPAQIQRPMRRANAISVAALILVLFRTRRLCSGLQNLRQEVLDPLVARIVEKLVRRLILYQLALVKHHDAVGDFPRKPQLVRNRQNGHL